MTNQGTSRTKLSLIRARTAAFARRVGAKGALVAVIAVLAGVAVVGRDGVTADSNTIDFEGYSLGTIHLQDGWSSSGPYDHAVATSGGGQALRVSNSVTSGSFGDQTFSKSLVDEAGESGAANDSMSGGTRESQYSAEFTLSSTIPGAQQVGMSMSISPDRGDGARMSYLRLEDQADGIHVFFDDYVDAAPFGGVIADPAGCDTEDLFIETDIVTLDRSVPHTVRFEMDFVDGPRNDVVRIYVDNTLEIAGTSWEDYFRYCEGNPTRTVDSLLFRTSGTAVAANAGNGLIFDDLTLQTFSPPPQCSTDCYVRPDGNDANTGTGDTAALAKQTIQAAVNQVSAGGTVHVATGTYTENVSIAKRLTLEGQGSGATDTVVTAASSGAPTILIDGDASTGISALAADRLTLRDIRITGATGGSGAANSGVQITGSASTNYVTFDNVASVANSGHGIAFDTTGTVTDVEVLSPTLSNNGNAGFSIRTNTPTFDGLEFNGGAIEHNAIQGIITGANGSPGVTNVLVDGTTFTKNGTSPSGGEGDLQFFKFNGNATIQNVNIDADAHSAIQFRGKDVPLAASGTIVLNNVSVTGTSTYGVQLQNYSSTAGVSMSDLDIATTGTFGLYLFGLSTNLDINDTEIGANTFSIANVSVADVDATGATFTGAADNFAIEDRVGHAIDAPGGGLVTWVLNNVYVTPNSFSVAAGTTFADIQRGVNEVTVNGNVNVAPGVFRNNVNVNKSVHIIGQGQGVTTVQPASSGPNPCGGGSLCGGSHVFLVAADDVEINDLTVDGDNTSLTSGVVISGADVDARNGIIENHSAGVWDSTHIHDVTVRNIYLRGIQVGSGGDNFSIHDNTVENVNGEAASIAIFNFEGTGEIEDNTVTDVNDGIASNWSRGTVYTGNTVSDAGSGIHTDNNGGAGGAADLIDDNLVFDCKPGGYGIWTFAPFVGPTVKDNEVLNCAVGLAAAGRNGGSAVVSSFTDNFVDGEGLAGSTGVYTTTDRFGFGSTNVDALFNGNVVIGNTDGFLIEAQPGFTNHTVANFNQISGNSTSGATATGAAADLDVDLAGNWWGNDTGPSHVLNIGGTANAASDKVAYSPWLGFGDASGAQGFQLASPMTWFVNPDICYGTCIQRAVDFASNGDTVKSKTGLYPEEVIINKSLIVTSASNPVIDAGGSGDAVTITADNVTFNDYDAINSTNGIVIAAGADNATVTNNVVNTFTSAGLRGESSTGHDISTNTITGPHTGSCVGGFWGMRLNNVSASIDDNDISGIGNGITTGCQEGRGIEALGAGTLQITDNDISLYQKSGIIVRDTLNSTITGNETLGEGSSAIIAMNGITVTSTGTTVIDDNDTSGHRYSPMPTFSCGILTFNTAQITNNRSNGGDEVGICAIGGIGSVITGNDVTAHAQIGIYVDDAANVLIDDNDVDGQGAAQTTDSAGTSPDDDVRYYGVFAVDSSGDISNNDITGIRHGAINGASFGLQSGVGIRVTARSGAAADVDITGNAVTDYQKNGMVITNVYGGTSVTADIDDNTVAGVGPTASIAQNGIQLSSGASGTITRNDVSGHDYTPFTAAAIGLLIFDAVSIFVDDNDVHDNMEGMYVENTDGALVTNNTFTDNYDVSIVIYGGSDSGIYDFNVFNGVPASSTGIYVVDVSTNNRARNNQYLANAYGVIVDYNYGAPLGSEFNDSDFIGNTIAGLEQTGTLVGPPVDAEDNWWNACDGPSGAGPGSGDAVSTNVDFTPFDHAACDSDNDLLTDGAEEEVHFTDYQDPDTDDDGCTDGEEVLFTPMFGGVRDPLNPWDFFDVTSDKVVDLQDSISVLQHFGHNYNGGLYMDALDNARDRYVPNVSQPWRSAEANNGIDLQDTLANLKQFGHNCQPMPN